jgi:hypothetical protein
MKRVGEQHHKHKLTSNQVDMLRHLHEVFEWGYKRLAKLAKVSIRTVRDIINYRTWCN